jgi:hypothetical protein
LASMSSRTAPRIVVHLLHIDVADGSDVVDPDAQSAAEGLGEVEAVAPRAVAAGSCWSA